MCEDSRDAERLKKQDSSLQETEVSTNVYNEAQYDDENVTDITGSNALESFHSMQDILAIDESGFFTCNTINTEQEKDIFLQSDKKKFNEWSKQLKDIEKMVLSAKRNSVDMAEQALCKNNIPDTLTGEKLIKKLQKKRKARDTIANTLEESRFRGTINCY